MSGSEPFQITEILGEGSFGTVCVARRVGRSANSLVALKILKGAYTQNYKIMNRTRDEARLMSKLHHPNIVRVEGLVELGGRPTIVMEMVEGISLDQLLKRFEDGVPATVAFEAIRLTLGALHFAYNEAAGQDGKPLRVIHRDIKPSNMLLSVYGDLKVVDFGIARGEFSGREAHTESVVLGSRPYMAPERLDGILDDPSVDVFSAGMSLFELLTGRMLRLSINPVAHEQALETQLRKLQIPTMSEQGLEHVRSVIARMCAYNREDRPSAMRAAVELKSCIRSVHERASISLPAFAQASVRPIYEARPRLSPDEAVSEPSESAFLREVTEQQKGPSDWGLAYVVIPLAVLFGLAVVLMALVVVVVIQSAGEVTSTESDVVRDERVEIDFYIADSMKLRVGDQAIEGSGSMALSPGLHRAVLEEDGRRSSCVFTVDGSSKIGRLLDGRLSIDGRSSPACTEIEN